MYRRAIAALVVAVLSVFLIPAAPVFAQSDSGQIRIVVDDGSAKTPIELARVVLDGPVVTSELTGKNGQVLFTDVPDGIYRARVAKSGYQTITSASFEVVNGRAVTLNVALALSTTLKVIGTVTAHSSVTVSTTSINEDSAQRKLSTDLADALNKLSGVTVSTSDDSSDATQTISLEGHDASQTQLTLDGIPLNAPGTAGNLGAFATDLFSGASVRTGPQAGGLGGGVNFSTLQPTISWLSNLQLGTGSNGKYNYSFAESGSVGKLGFAAQNTYRLMPSLVDGEKFLDASGLDYVHDGDSTVSGNLAKLRYEFSDSQTLTGTFMSSARDTAIACLRISGGLPCGSGPNNTNDNSMQLYSLTDNALIGETTVQASVYSSTFHTVSDQLNRFVNGEAEPIEFSTDVRNAGYSVSATLPSRERHTISLQTYATTSELATTPLVSQARPYYFGSQPSSYASFQINDSIRSNDKLTLGESFGASRASNASASVLGSVSATWRPTARDTLSASYAIGGVAASPGRSTILTDPASLRFDCNGNVAYGNAPGDQPAANSSTSSRASYTRALHAGSVTFSVYRQVQNNVVLPVQVNGSALVDMGILSPDYLARVRQLYDSPAGCNAAAGTPFAASQLYFSSPVGGVQRTYQGGSVSGFIQLGRLVVQPYYNVQSATIQSNDPRIANPYSITISGAQVPNVPLHRAGITLDYRAPHSSVEWLADAQYVGGNNPNNLPAYTTFDAGASTQLKSGTLTVAASNITNAYAGIFASPQNAVPYVTENGTTIATLARPLQPRSYSVTYNVKFGPGAAAATSRGTTPALSRGYTGGPDGGPPPGGPGESGGRGGMRNFLTPLPTTPPADPLGLNTSNALCTADAQKSAGPLSTQLKAAVDAIERAKTATGYPATIDLPAVDGATLTYHGLGSTYALALTPKLQGTSGGGRMRAFIGCFQMHMAGADDVKSRNLYDSASGMMFVPQVYFMPSVGLYVVARQQQAGQETFRIYKLPTTAPKEVFNVRSAAQCTGDVRNTAQQSLGELQAYFTKNAPPKNWTITPHAAKSGTWYELAPGDPAVLGAILMCGHVAAAAPDELTTRGYDGARPPSLNYAKDLGLYIVRQQRPPGAPGT